MAQAKTPDDVSPPSIRDHGCLPDWQTGDLPEPLPLNVKNIFRTIGPGAILLAGSIGGGEWIVGPLTAVRFGTGILWVATLGIFLQMILNLEAIRYTLYSGEPVLTGIMRLNPGSKFWGLFYIVAGTAQLATPAMALGCANVLFTASADRLPAAAGDDGGYLVQFYMALESAQFFGTPATAVGPAQLLARASASPFPGDGRTVMWIAYGVLALTVMLLLSGKSIERLLEKLSWAMIIFIFVFLLIANVLFVPLEIWRSTAVGFLVPRGLPPNMDLMLLGVFAATAGSGGLGNLAISNWSRDKGLGMGKWMGSIGGVLSGSDNEVSSVGRVFLPTADNLRRWAIWWRYSLLDQSVLWAMGCVLGMYLNVNLALAIVPPDNVPPDSAAGAFQARFMAEQLWHGFWALALINGFWILFSTQLGNTDCLTRVVTDTCLAGWPNLRRWASSRLYAVLLSLFTIWGVVAIANGKSALSLFKILGLLAGPIMTVSSFQILRVNTRFLPKGIRPPLWRKAGLIVCGLVYGVLSIASLYSLVTGK